MKRKPRKKRVYPRITAISMSRLYNTGNYTNVNYSLTAEVPKGASAEETLTELARILHALRPERPPTELDSLERARLEPLGGRSEYQKEQFAEWLKIEEKWKAKLARREAALQSLDKLGGSARARDAKDDWDENDDYPF